MYKPGNHIHLMRYSWIMMGLLLLLACEEVIDLPAREVGGQWVVSGLLSNSDQGNEVKVFRTAAYGQPAEPISSAMVRVIASSGEVFSLRPGAPGHYEFDPGFRGTVGESYRLEVELAGELMATDFQTMMPLVGKDSLYYNVTVEETISSGVLIQEDVVQILASTTFDTLPEEFYLRWEISEIWTYLGTYVPPDYQIQCYVYRDLNRQSIFLHDGSENRALSIPNIQYASRHIDRSFLGKHYFNLVKFNISEEAHEYWQRLDQIVNLQGSLFDPAPAAVPGNVSSDTGEEILGFFEVASVDTARMLMTNNDIPLFLFDPCAMRGDQFLELLSYGRCFECMIDAGLVPAHCIRCGILEGSDAPRPGYF